jgi:DNA replication initiation complex subunit (GINS family)
MTFEQAPSPYEEKERSQEELIKIGERVFEKISQTKEQIKKLKEEKQKLLENNSNSDEESLRIKNIEIIACQLEAKLITFEDLAGIE